MKLALIALMACGMWGQTTLGSFTPATCYDGFRDLMRCTVPDGIYVCKDGECHPQRVWRVPDEKPKVTEQPKPKNPVPSDWIEMEALSYTPVVPVKITEPLHKTRAVESGLNGLLLMPHDNGNVCTQPCPRVENYDTCANPKDFMLTDSAGKVWCVDLRGEK